MVKLQFLVVFKKGFSSKIPRIFFNNGIIIILKFLTLWQVQKIVLFWGIYKFFNFFLLIFYVDLKSIYFWLFDIVKIYVFRIFLIFWNALCSHCMGTFSIFYSQPPWQPLCIISWLSLHWLSFAFSISDFY